MFSKTKHFKNEFKSKDFDTCLKIDLKPFLFLKGKAFISKNGFFQNIFKATPFETRRGEEFIKQNLFTNILFSKSFANHFGNKLIFGKDSDSLLNREGPAERISNCPSHI